VKTLNYWGPCGGDLSSTLHLSGNEDGIKQGSAAEYLLKLYSPKGELFKELSIGIDPGKALSVELDNLIGELLPDLGFRHSLMSLTMPDSCAVGVRLKSAFNTFFAGPLRKVSTLEPAFFPKLFSRSISSYLILSNPTENPIEAIVRLIAPNRAPENNYELKPYTTKLISVEAEFDEITDLSMKQRISSYVRTRCKTENALAVGMFEQYATENGCNYIMVN